MPVENTEAVVANQKGKPRAVIYFHRDQTKVATDIAAALRANNKIANLVFSNLFVDAADCEKCEAVAIQASSSRVHAIAKAYRKTFPDVELHFFDDEGNFVEGPTIEDRERFEMPVLKTGGKVPVEPEPPAAEEIAATKAALAAEAGDDTNDETILTDTPEHSDSSTEAASDNDAAAEAETADDAESKKGNESRGKSRKS